MLQESQYGGGSSPAPREGQTHTRQEFKSIKRVSTVEPGKALVCSLSLPGQECSHLISFNHLLDQWLESLKNPVIPHFSVGLVLNSH